MLSGEPEKWSTGVVNRQISPIYKGQNVTMVRRYCDTADCNIKRADFITSKGEAPHPFLLSAVIILYFFFQ
ncbi:unnamed protein product [Oikopleura dioica]|uniref:Uncharacterized protein n=1 Tax=Oikopleura dioica TaxID=34765 RepID=E4YBW9_OIKDI|nr:unnamed protein product [Oikopleura dioica]